MANVNFIARADDLGSSHSANQAIDAVSRAGFVKNVSVMAPGPAVEQAAALLAGRKDICFGMHTTLNAEWDRVRWGPVLPLDEKSGLIDENGSFLCDPALFVDTKPAVETIMREVGAQLERLHALGFNIRYVDSHMFPEMAVPGLDEAMAEFARQKGLLDHMCFYNPPPGLHDLRGGLDGLTETLKTMPAGQYFLVTHPALDTVETRQAGNAQVSGAEVAESRAHEAAVLSAPETAALLRRLGCEGIRYDEAVPQKRASVEDLKKLLLGGHEGEDV